MAQTNDEQELPNSPRELLSILNDMMSQVDDLWGFLDVEGKERRIAEIAAQEEDPSLWSDNQKAAAILKEKKALQLVLEPCLDTKHKVEDALTLLELCRESGDQLDKDSLSEIHHSILKGREGFKKLRLQKMLSGELDSCDCYLSVNAGAGGTEACDWAGMLARMYTRYANDKDFKVTTMDFTEGDGAGFRGVTFEITGLYAYGYLKAEIGVHRLVRISPFDSNARRHTSFASVFVYPVIDDTIEVELKMEDVRVDTYRSSGAGGQHVNKVESAVRMTHEPTGIVVQCQAERSQIQNREKCLKMLRARLYELELKKRQDEADKMNATKKSISWGSQIRNYVFQPYQMVKDVRTGAETSSIQRVMDGDIQEFIENYLMQVSEGTLGQNASAEDDL
ncbi:peptide chain release factor 2 [bacterium]|nr:peptide chain release factor 2 [bacterium]